MDNIKEKIPWFAQLTLTKMYPEWGELMIQESEESWDKSTYESKMSAFLSKYGFRLRTDEDTLYEATKIWEKYYTEADLPEE